MQSIELRNQLLFYYGNPVGYQTKHGLIVDSIFYRQELEDWLIKKGLTVQWTNGVYDRLACGVSLGAKTLPVKSLRIWQLRPDMPIDMRFISLEQMSIKYGGPNPECYHPVYEGSTDTEDLEAIWNEFSRMALPHSEWPLAISDVIELYDETSSRFFYVDSCEIVPITFVAHNDQQTGIIQEKSNTQVDFSQMLQQEYESYMNQIQNYSIRKILDLAEEIADIKSIYMRITASRPNRKNGLHPWKIHLNLSVLPGVKCTRRRNKVLLKPVNTLSCRKGKKGHSNFQYDALVNPQCLC